MAEANFHWFKTEEFLSFALKEKERLPEERFSFAVIFHRLIRQLFVFSDRLEMSDRRFRQTIRDENSPLENL